MKLIRQYGFPGTINLFWNWVLTKLTFPKARIIRFPCDIRNKAFISVSEGFTTGRYCRLEAYPLPNQSTPSISFGKNVQINDSVHIAGSIGIHIGNRVLIASKVFITDLNHGTYSGDSIHSKPETTAQERPLSYKKVIIEDNVWIGEFVAVLPGVTIGENSIIGAMSVVSRSIPPNSIAVGSPARVIKTFDASTGRWKLS